MSAQPIMTGSMREFTPKEAAFLLENKNINNRPIRQSEVARYARQMAEGKWCSQVTDAIGFTTNGELTNGQHRLSAVVQAGIPVTFFVAYNVPKEAYAYTDIGAKRNISDRTNLNKKETDIVTSLIRVLGAGASAAADPDEVSVVHQAFELEIKLFSGSGGGKAAKGATASMRAALVMLTADGLDKDLLAAQLHAFANGHQDLMSPSVAALHARFNGRKSRVSSLEREEVFAESIRAYGGRTDRVRDIITEYREKFGKLLSKL